MKTPKIQVKPRDAKPCPFCGGSPSVFRETELNWVLGRYTRFIIRCNQFRCRVAPRVEKNNLREAMEAWNQRV